ncbi:hypothetical protein Cni_G00209 [Canna indica]|uniref:RING-type E3 ubiquitin transferase n=1 Tax=Canna indica TaxID=4628 RepID=A0AAQ3JKS2_9LILI|nr:hypothetical protein Cni_G00209 [Canna indica]
MSSIIPPAPVLWLPPDDAGQDNNMNTSILATALISLALVMAVVLFLHLYVRLVLGRRLPAGRRSRLTTIGSFRLHAATILIEDPPTTVGLDPSTIAALPSFPYEKTTGAEDESSAECAVCLSAVEDGEMTRLLPGCKHLFHVGCIDMWLASHVTCPVCRAMVEPPPATPVRVSNVGETETSSAAGQPAARPVVVGQSSGEGTSRSKEGGSISARLSASLKRILSTRDRSSSASSSRRAHGESTEDLERR